MHKHVDVLSSSLVPMEADGKAPNEDAVGPDACQKVVDCLKSFCSFVHDFKQMTSNTRHGRKG